MITSLRSLSGAAALASLTAVMACEAASLPAGTPFARVAITPVSQVTTGAYHSCALVRTGGVVCWGAEWDGHLGNGTDVSTALPVEVVGISDATAVGAGTGHTCALTGSGRALCWGFNESGQIGDGTTTTRLAPVEVSGLDAGVTALAAGGNHTCALTTAATVVCWGSNEHGQLGNGTTDPSAIPVAVTGLTGVTGLAAGSTHTCAIVAAGRVACWGFNRSGQLGDGTRADRTTAVTVSGLSGTKGLAAGVEHTCALARTGAVRCWGDNRRGALGDGTTSSRTRPVAVIGLARGVAAIAAGGHTCALTTAGAASCWGWNFYGQLGDGWNRRGRSRPVAVSHLASGVAGIAVGDAHTCAVTVAGGVKCWGRNNYREVGDGTPTTRVVPTDVIGLGAGPPAKCRVPDVRRKTLALAKVALRRAYCALGRVGWAYSSVKKERVVSQRPAAGRSRALRTRVDVVLSRGRRDDGAVDASSVKWLRDGRTVEVLGWKGTFKRNKQPSIWLMDADGSDRRVLVERYFYDYELIATSPSGATLAAGYNVGRAGHARLEIRRGAQHTIFKLPTRGWTEVDEVVWAPHERAVAVEVSRDADRGPGELIFVVDLVTGRVHLVSRVRTRDDRDPAWAPDGCRLAFWSCGQFSSRCRLTLARPDGAGRVEIGRTEYSSDLGSPVWAPDGSAIAFARHFGPQFPNPPPSGSRKWGIYVLRPDGSHLQRVAATAPTTSSWMTPAWSPDSLSIAFAHKTGITVADVRTRTQDRFAALGKTESSNPVAWAPSAKMAFVHEGDVYTLLPGSQRRPVRILR